METILKNNEVVLFLPPYKVGQFRNFWTHPRIFDIYPAFIGIWKENDGGHFIKH